MDLAKEVALIKVPYNITKVKSFQIKYEDKAENKYKMHVHIFRGGCAKASPTKLRLREIRMMNHQQMMTPRQKNDVQ